MDTEANLRRSAILVHESAVRGIEFLETDVDTALNFAAIALQSQSDPERRIRNTRNARSGFDAVVHFSKRLNRTLVSDAAMTNLQEKLEVLKSRLEELGQTISE